MKSWVAPWVIAENLPSESVRPTQRWSKPPQTAQGMGEPVGVGMGGACERSAL